METPYWIYYIIGINVIGFISYLVNIWFYTYTPNGEIDKVLTIVAGIGGALGIVLTILLFDPESKKYNMMTRVFVYSVLVIQIVLFLFVRSDHCDGITFTWHSFICLQTLSVIYGLLFHQVFWFASFQTYYSLINLSFPFLRSLQWYSVLGNYRIIKLTIS